jgi:hypothetical protein
MARCIVNHNVPDQTVFVLASIERVSMCPATDSPTSCEICTVIRFLLAKNVNVDQNIVNECSLEFHNSHLNFHKLHARDYHIEARLLKVLGNLVSAYAHGCTQNADNGFFNLETFARRRSHAHDEFLNHVVWITSDETWVSFVSARTKEQP